MKKKNINRIFCAVYLLLFPFLLPAQEKQLTSYDITWSSSSNNAGASMPCGGGDIGMNAWVENGEVLIYVARSGNFDENNALFKTGRIRIKIFPTVFDGKDFKQQLHLSEGYVSIQGTKNGITATIKIWADIFQPVAHFEINANRKINVEASYETWRYRDRIIAARENFGNSWKWAAPKNNIYKKDSISFNKEAIIFFHQNKNETIFDATVQQQWLISIKDSLYNPLKDLIFGGSFSGKNFAPAGQSSGVYANTDYHAWKLKSGSSSRTHSLELFLWNSNTSSEKWKQSLDSLRNAVNNSNAQSLANKNWWNTFWQRSFIYVEKDKASEGWELGRNYQLFRYMLALNAKGNWPTKFNGGLLTVDPVFTDTSLHLTPDYRNWGGGLHTAQNQRLVYFPMIRSGDWEMMQSQFNFYLRILKNAEWRSRIYWNHPGACFTEQMENYGLPDYAEYGQKRPENFDKGVEYNAWLEYQWDTVLEFCLMMLEEYAYTNADIKTKIPFIESCLKFFEEHYQFLAKQRGNKMLDGNGHLILYPTSAGETFKMATNSTTTVAALQVITAKLLSLPAEHLSSQTITWLKAFQKKIPPIPLTTDYGDSTIAPAAHWERISNVESPQLYPLFPWGIYGIKKPGFKTALNTWNRDTNVIKFRSYLGWKQDNIWAARLGLTQEAWRLTALKLKSGSQRFPAFWGPGFDWTPDHNWGGTAMIGLQEMLLQTDGDRILLFPAWPKEKDVHFKLHAPQQTTVEAEWKDGKLIMLDVSPASRKKDIEMMIQ